MNVPRPEASSVRRVIRLATVGVVPKVVHPDASFVKRDPRFAIEGVVAKVSKPEARVTPAQDVRSLSIGCFSVSNSWIAAWTSVAAILPAGVNEIAEATK